MTFKIGENKMKGFTFIELLVVVLIVGILAGVALPLYNKAVFKAQLAQVLLQVRSIRNDIQMYHLANGVWPKNMDDLTVWDYIDEKGIAHIGKVSYTNRNSAYMTTNNPLVSASDFFQCAIWFTEVEPPFCTTRIGAAANMLEANGWKWRHTNEASNSTSYYMPL